MISFKSYWKEFQLMSCFYKLQHLSVWSRVTAVTDEDMANMVLLPSCSGFLSLPHPCVFCSSMLVSAWTCFCFVSLRQDVTVSPVMARGSLCRSIWLWTHRDPPVLVSWVLSLKVKTIILSSSSLVLKEHHLGLLPQYPMLAIYTYFLSYP